jgi:phosphoribosylpyrophosphate synthetase
MDVFGDGEPNDKIVDPDRLVSADVLLFQSMNDPVLEDQFLDLAYAAMHQFGARSVTGILPFMRFRRQDHPKNGELDRNARLINNIASVGVTRLLFCDIHSQITLDNCQREQITAWNVDAAAAFVPHLESIVATAKQAGREIFCYSPDEGALEGAMTLARALGVRVAINFKERLPTGKVIIIDKPERLAELKAQHGQDFIFGSDVLPGATVIIRDDELSTGGTARLTGWRLVEEIKAHEVVFTFTQAVCAPGWRQNFLDKSPFAAIYSGNTLEIRYSKATGGKIHRVDMASVIAAKLAEIIGEIKQ